MYSDQANYLQGHPGADQGKDTEWDKVGTDNKG